MAGDFNDLCEVGISYPQAIEIGRQIALGVGDPNLLCCTGMNAGPAIELARQISSGVFSADLLCAAMWEGTQAIELALLGGVFPGAVPGFTLNAQGYLVSNADGSLWVFAIDSDGVFGLDATTGNYLIEAN